MIIIHRVNTIQKLQQVPKKYGVEIDIRGVYDQIYLSHDPLDKQSEYCTIQEYLKYYDHSFIIINVKEMGYEKKIIALLREHNIHNFFLLDVEFPYIYNNQQYEPQIAMRYSEKESIQNVMLNECEWVWIDTNTKLPLDTVSTSILSKYKTCLVCPERWGRPENISTYIDLLRELNFKLDAVMTSMQQVSKWEKYFD